MGEETQNQSCKPLIRVSDLCPSNIALLSLSCYLCTRGQSGSSGGFYCGCVSVTALKELPTQALSQKLSLWQKRSRNKLEKEAALLPTLKIFLS